MLEGISSIWTPSEKHYHPVRETGESRQRNTSWPQNPVRETGVGYCYTLALFAAKRALRSVS